MSQLIEDFLPPIQSAGLNTNKNAALGGTLSVTGASTLTGNATFSGTVVGGKSNVVLVTSPTTLTAAQSGSEVVFNSTTGTMVTLPTPAAGLTYQFVVAKTPATASHGIITDGSTFLVGTVALTSSTGATLYFTGDGSTTIALRMNGSTTGGTTASLVNVTAISSTQWMVTGQLYGTGALVTPFNTV